MNEEKEKNISEILNLIGYGLAKFDLEFVKEFGFTTKTAFNQYVVDLGLADTIKAVSNRQDSFDPYFDNGRKGWWQRKQREHIKIFIDSLFGNENVKGFANIVKLYIVDYDTNVNLKIEQVTPITNSKVRQMKETGSEAEFYFMQNYKTVQQFENGNLEDARLWSDGYDFQIEISKNYFLAEVKGVAKNSGNIRMTEKEYQKAQEFSNSYFLVVVSNLINTPKMTVIENPLQEIEFIKNIVPQKEIIQYYSPNLKW